MVPSGAGYDTYTVSLNPETCSTCQLMCRQCNACIHKFSCTCVDHAVKFNMCKHIHLVAQRNLTAQSLKDSEPVEAGALGKPRQQLVIDEAKTVETTKLVTALSSNDEESSFDDLKQAIDAKVRFALNHCSTKEEAGILMDSIDNALIKMRAIRQQRSIQGFAQTEKVDVRRKIDPQRQFIKKKKIKPKKKI
uniref:Chromosome partition protein Smc n=1 Tax=Lygus hesperus TaxID=30085 RepID=A0A0A9YVW8_LYGHE